MNMRQKKRGRPRQNRPTIDLGTRELQDKRASLLGDKSPALSESLLGILYGRQLISPSLYKAGVCFGELAYRYEPCAGHKFRQYSSSLLYGRNEGYGDSPDRWSDREHEKRTMAWRKAVQALKQAGNEPYKTVMTVVFYDQDLYLNPRRMIPCVQPLQRGLKFLDAYFKGELQDRLDKLHDLERNPRKSTTFPLASKEFPPGFRA